MTWFRHYTSSSRDQHLLSLRDEFGMEGYGAYWSIVESIAEQGRITNLGFSMTLSYRNWRKISEMSPKKVHKVY